MLRLFVAVDLPIQVQQMVAALCAGVRSARWVKPHQLHVTLRFMGQTPDQDLPAIRERLARVAAPSFALRLQGVGTFPPVARKARVLWLGLEPTQMLVALARDINACLGDLGLRPDEESRAFAPHLTLARFNGKPDEDLTRFLAQHASLRSLDWCVEEFRLYRSTLHERGAAHEVLSTYLLGKICRQG
jgi:RNA 2',3'-cyclic 3'-phosphodiesterase